jgi:hypothetical protein
VVRLMDRLNELDCDNLQKNIFELNYNSQPVRTKKKRILGLNDSREHDFDM